IEKAAGGVLTAKQAPTGPAPPRRSVCAQDAMSLHSITDHPREGGSHVVPLFVQYAATAILTQATPPKTASPAGRRVAARMSRGSCAAELLTGGSVRRRFKPHAG